MRVLSAAAFGAWLAWFILVVTHYFAIPPELVVVFDHPLSTATHWREAAREALRALNGAALMWLAALGAGIPALYATKRMLETTLERVTIVPALGCAMLGSVFQLLAWLGLYRPSVVTAVVMILAAGGLIVLLGIRIHVTRPDRVRWHEAAYAASAAAALVCSFVAALAPEIEYDALWYHLWLPAKWLEAGRAVDIVEEYVSLYPLGWDLVGGGAVVLGGAVAAKLLHFACLPLTGACAYLLTRQLFPGTSAWLASAMAIVTPITMWEASTAYLDLAIAWFVSLSVYALTRYHTSEDRRWLILSALLMSAALASKHLALVAFAIITGAIALREIVVTKNVGSALRSVTLFVALSMALPTPWYIRAYRASGNPVFPDLYGVFGARPPERWSPLTERGLQAFKDRFGTRRTPGNIARLPWDATVHAAAFGGTLGPLFLIFVPVALVGRAMGGIALTVTAASVTYIAVWASPISSFQMRFLIPIVPLVATLGAAGVARVERAARAISPRAPNAVVAAVLAILFFNLPPTSGWHEPDRHHDTGWMTHILRGLPLAVVIGAESRTDYLLRAVPSYGAWQYVDAKLPKESTILTFSGGDHFYGTRPRIWSDATLARSASWGTPAGEERTALEALRTLSVTHVLFDKRQLQDGSVRALAIGSDTMLACCLSRLYEDSRFALYRVD